MRFRLTALTKNNAILVQWQSPSSIWTRASIYFSLLCTACLRANYICTVQRSMVAFLRDLLYPVTEPDWTHRAHRKFKRCSTRSWLMFIRCRRWKCKTRSCSDNHSRYTGAERDTEREAQLTSSVVTHTCSRMQSP